jgi:UDP-N-acetylmuramoylalanine--D-glutamate ligase
MRVASINGVDYINDSKATNDQAAAMALQTYHPIYWIAGGKPKDGGYADCAKHIGNVRHAYLIGAAQEILAAFLSSHKIPFTRCGTMDRAVAAAHQAAQAEKLAGAVVLLSPACASFDQFKNFEQRGDAFTDLVKNLTPQAKTGAA